VEKEHCGAMLCEDALKGFALGERLHREGGAAP
jgi:hypothetical protein